MKNAIPLQWLSYVMVAAVGATAGWFARPGNDAARELVPARENWPSTPPVSEGAELLDAFVQKRKAPDSPTKDSFTDRFEKLGKTFPVSADPAADFQKLLAEFSAKMESGEPAMAPGPGMDQLAMLGLLLGQWMDVDAKAAFSFVAKGYRSPGGTRIVGNLFLNDLAAKYLGKRGLPAFMDAISVSGNLVESLVPAVSADLAKRGSLQELELMKAKAPDFFNNPQMGSELGKAWPLERRDELLAALAPKTAAEVMTGIAARMEGTSGGEWILGKLRSGEISPELRNAMAKGSIGLPDRVVDGMPLQQRIDIMRELGTLGDADEEQIKRRLISSTLDKWFTSGKNDDDSLFALHHGMLTTREVAEMAGDNTLAPGENRVAYDSEMFRALAQENLTAAMDLLEGMPPHEREKVKAEAASGAGRDMRPDDFFQLTESVNAGGDEELQAKLQDAWNTRAATQLPRFGRFYLDWVKTLPAGENKTRALKSIRQGGLPKLAAEASEILNEP